MLDEHRLRDVCDREGVLALYLFGSRARGEASGTSDYDFGVLLSRGDDRGRNLDLVLRLEAELQQCAGGARVDVGILREASLEFQFVVISEGIVLYERDEDARTDYEDSVLRLYLDWAVELRMYREEVAEDIRAGGPE